MIGKKQLINLGFKDKEARVYLTLLELGMAPVTEIARRAKINRTTGYDILELLVKKGIASRVGEGKIQQYASEMPDKLLTYLEKRARQTQAKIKVAQTLLPELKSIYKQGAKPTVKFYEGKEGVRQAFEDTLTTRDTIVGYACGEPMYKVLPDYFSTYFQKRVAKNIHTKGILPDTIRVRETVQHNKEQLRESRLVPKELFDLAIEINIYDNKVLIVSWEENIALIIESEKIAEAQKKIFELAWKGAGEITKTK